MTTAPTNVSVGLEPRLLGQTVVVIGGSATPPMSVRRAVRARLPDRSRYVHILGTTSHPRFSPRPARSVGVRQMTIPPTVWPASGTISGARCRRARRLRRGPSTLEA